jgi:hypothetical protein
LFSLFSLFSSFSLPHCFFVALFTWSSAFPGALTLYFFSHVLCSTRFAPRALHHALCTALFAPRSAIAGLSGFFDS